MTKQLDWNSIASVNFDDQRRKNTNTMTGKELFSKAFENMKKSEEALQRRREIEPVLRKALLAAIVAKQPILVNLPINNPTESFGGLQKGEEDDNFYNSSPSANAEAKAATRFEEVMETIPAGTSLIFKSHDRQLKQLIFKGSNGCEYAVYEQNVVMFRGSQIENPGLFGLLFNTDLIDGIEA